MPSRTRQKRCRRCQLHHQGLNFARQKSTLDIVVGGCSNRLYEAVGSKKETKLYEDHFYPPLSFDWQKFESILFNQYSNSISLYCEHP